MKKVFLIFVALLSACAGSEKVETQPTTIESSVALKYRAQIKICDDEAERKSKKTEYSTTVGISRAISEKIECYKTIAYGIIEKDYTHNSERMKEDLAAYIRLSSDLTAMALRPDNCYPYCGTIVGNLAAESSFEHVKKYLDILIDGAQDFGE